MKFCENPACKNHVEVGAEFLRYGRMEVLVTPLEGSCDFRRRMVTTEELQMEVTPHGTNPYERRWKSVRVCSDCKPNLEWFLKWVNECIKIRETRK